MNLPNYFLSDQVNSASSKILNITLASPSPKSNPPSKKSSPPSQLENDGDPVGFDEFFTLARSDGWSIYKISPLRLIHKIVIPNGSLKIVLPLHHSNLVFLVGGPPSPLYSPNKIVIFDLSISKAVFSIEFTSNVLGLTAKNDNILVVLLNKIFLFNLSKNQICLQTSWDTCSNPKGLIALNSDFTSNLLTFPARQSGKLHLVHLSPFNLHPSNHQISNSSPHPSTSILVAHTTPLACLALTPSGHLIATASIKGTLIRIWDTKSSILLRELRRGSDTADIWSLRFSPDGHAIGASSDKGTIHFWNLKEKFNSKIQNQSDKINKPLTLIKPYLPKYFHSTWSDGFFKLPPPASTSNRSLQNLFSLNSFKPDSSKSNHSNHQTQSASNQIPTIENDPSLVSWVLSSHSINGISSIEPQIVVVTRSGRWFRLRIPNPSKPHSPSSNQFMQSSHLTSITESNKHPTHNKSTATQDKPFELECVEYLRFGDDDDWSDSEDENGN
ncbi:hypothetical protein O181_075918 [Austropuccinia psidii MF-1]|uniref:Anaphase-promoting complex subunit 4 WD40 domain-containing protein n=1 Tax=Austropuccinia psidii MF-1 TaxID=1389203 RepID=A0A9Q3FDY4_9BASI|nr:hypothetical protein [Austropuccinia psidii MF-1]